MVASACFAAAATVACPEAMACNMSISVLALSTSDHLVEVGVNQLFCAAWSSVAVMPVTAEDRLVVLGSRPFWASSVWYLTPVIVRIQSYARPALWLPADATRL